MKMGPTIIRPIGYLDHLMSDLSVVLVAELHHTNKTIP